MFNYKPKTRTSLLIECSYRETIMNLSAKNFRLLVLSSAMAAIAIFSPVNAQLDPPTEPSFGGSVPKSRKVVSGIIWYGILKDGLAEAKRTGKPILFVTAAPQCGGIPGMW